MNRIGRDYFAEARNELKGISEAGEDAEDEPRERRRKKKPNDERGGMNRRGR